MCSTQISRGYKAVLHSSPSPPTEKTKEEKFLWYECIQVVSSAARREAWWWLGVAKVFHKAVMKAAPPACRGSRRTGRTGRAADTVDPTIFC